MDNQSYTQNTPNYHTNDTDGKPVAVHNCENNQLVGEYNSFRQAKNQCGLGSDCGSTIVDKYKNNGKRKTTMAKMLGFKVYLVYANFDN